MTIFEILINYGLCLLACCVGTSVIEFFYKPKPHPIWKRSYPAITIHMLLVAAVYTLALLVTQRFFFSIGICLSASIIILAVNNAKYATLREPLVFSDFFLYLQVFQHPRLYLPFLGIFPLILLSTIGIGIVLAGVVLEESSFNWFSLPTLFLSFVLALIIYLLSKSSAKADISLKLEQDCKGLGVIVTVCIYAFKASKHRDNLDQMILKESAFSKDKISDISKENVLADIVVVQSESFFDARSLSPNILEDVLSGYDKCLISSEAFGKLNVPAWGANTMRTEFGFLTGLAPHQLGLAQFYPYQQLHKMKVPSIVSALKSLGYYCVCIHPNASGFFMRDKFFKQLGFDEFVDEKSFGGAAREGPYIADQAVTEKIMKVLREASKPCFVFAITMENHGPLNLEALSDDEWVDYYKSFPELDLDDLTKYLRHLKNADQMISQLCDFFSKGDSAALFALYGDHVPAISNVFEKMDYDDPRSNYFVWSNDKNHPNIPSTSTERVLSIEDLGLYLLDVIGSKKNKKSQERG